MNFASLIRCGAIVALAWTISPAPAQADFLIALTQSNTLISFDSGSPNMTSAPVSITGLSAGDQLVGLANRPATGELFSFAMNGSVGRLYTINPFTGVAVLRSTISEPVSGTFYGVSFNPVPDRLRLISDTGMNLRINVDTGAAIVDGTPAYATGDVNEGATPAIVASAYTNSFAGATETSLYNLDLETQSLVLQNPPNAGTLNTIGSLGEFVFPPASFDIVAGSNRGLVVLNGSDLLEVDLATGNTSFIGTINSNSNIVSIAANAIPEPSSLLCLAVGSVLMFVRRRK